MGEMGEMGGLFGVTATVGTYARARLDGGCGDEAERGWFGERVLLLLRL